MKLANRENTPGVISQSYETMHTPTNIAKELFLYVEYIGHAFCDQRYYLSRKSYANYLMMYVIDGEAFLVNSGGEYFVVPGQVFLIESSQPHIYGAVGNLECIWLHFNGADFKKIFDYLIYENGGHVFSPGEAAQFYTQFNDLLNSYISDSPNPEIIASAQIYSLISLLNSYTVSDIKSPIDTALKYINLNFDKKISLNDMAKQSCMSVSHFSKIFRTTTGYSPYNYIIMTRLNASRQLLSTTDMTVEEIALKVGFNDASSFVYSFRNKYNITPYQFRKNLQYVNLEPKEFRRN